MCSGLLVVVSACIGGLLVVVSACVVDCWLCAERLNSCRQWPVKDLTVHDCNVRYPLTVNTDLTTM